ncbi:MAG: class I SAM-dependent methyltransferase [Pseudomonadota bacterium]
MLELDQRAPLDFSASMAVARPNEDASVCARYEALFQLGCSLKRGGYRFTTVTPATHRRVNARPGNFYSSDVAGIFGWSRSFAPAEISKPLLRNMVLAEVIAEVDQPNWRLTVRASTLDGELYFHSAYPTSEKDAVFFGPDSYRFVRALRHQLTLDRPNIARAVDIGCGAGPGAISIALRYPQAQVLAVDINPAAVALTTVNTRLAGAGNLQALESNLLHCVDGEFDLIVSNPPYLLDGEQRAYRHGGGELGAGLSLDVVRCALQRLAAGGSLMLYTGVAMVDNRDPFLAEVQAMLDDSGFVWSYEEIDPDVFGEELEQAPYRHTERVAVVWLVATRPAVAS